MENPQVEAALVILVPEVELLLQSIQSEYNLIQAEYVPAHITINYPFIPGVEPGEALYRKLEDVFSSVQPFRFSLTHTGKFQNALYLTPEPEDPFMNLIEVIKKEFPGSPPYRGAYDAIIPHLTVIQSEDPDVLDRIEGQLLMTLPDIQTISVLASQVTLLDNCPGCWREQKNFKLGKDQLA